MQSATAELPECRERTPGRSESAPTRSAPSRTATPPTRPLPSVGAAMLAAPYATAQDHKQHLRKSILMGMWVLMPDRTTLEADCRRLHADLQLSDIPGAWGDMVRAVRDLGRRNRPLSVRQLTRILG